MNEILEALERIWIYQIQEYRLVFFFYGIIAFLLFYHFTINILIKYNFSFIKASLTFLVIYLILDSSSNLINIHYSKEPIDNKSWQIFYALIIKITFVFLLYTLLYKKFLITKNRFTNRLQVFLVLICFGLYYTPFFYILKYGGRYHFNLHLKLTFALYAITATGFNVIISNIFKSQRNKDDEVKLENLVLKEQVIKTQYELLHAKVNPHFLYNSLNSIAGLALSDGEKTKKMALSLSRFFKYSINRESKNITTISEEMEMVNTYLEIEKIRFEDRLYYSIFVEPETEDLEIPKFLIQPLVENSVKHGQNLNDFTITITLEIKQLNNKLLISIKDKGKPYDDDMEPGYGIKSVYDKLDLFCQGKYEIAFVNSPEKSIDITIEL